MPTIQSNIKYAREILLNKIRNPDLRADAHSTIVLYEERKITNFKTVEKILEKLASKREITRNAGLKLFNQNVISDKTLTTLKEKLQNTEIKKKIKRSSNQQLGSLQFKLVAFSEKPMNKQKPKYVNGGQFFAMCAPKIMTVDLKYEFPKEFKNKYITKSLNYNTQLKSHRQNNPEFHELIQILETNDEFSAWHHQVKDYLEMVHLSNFTSIDSSPPNKNFIDWKSRDTEHISINYKYISTDIDLDKDTFKSAIEKKNYIKNECWINCIVEMYQDFLFNRKREPLTREKLLKLIDKTEDDIKEGITISQMIPFFDKYNIPVKLFDMSYNLRWRHNQNNINSQIKPLYVLMKDNHIYVLNHDLKRLEQKLNEEHHVKLTASDNYYVNEKSQYNTFKMLESLDDIIKIIKDHISNHPDEKKDEQHTFNCIYKTNKLEKLLFECIESGYQPQVKFQAGSIQNISIKIKGKFNFLIRNQNLLPDCIDGEIQVDREDEYNKMFIAQGEFHDAIFIPSHKSYYSKYDVDIMDEYRTVAQSGLLKQVDPYAKITEIDVSKAYTKSLSQITKIPIFNEFDIFTTYDGSDIEDLSLYVIKTINENLFLNKQFNLVYGQILKQLPTEDYEIIQYKQPSKIKEVDYNKIVDQLYNTEFSKDEDTNKLIKKTIANVNVGLLEKGINKTTRSFIFSDLNECKFFQSEYGGKIIAIDKEKTPYHIKREFVDRGLDYGVETKIISSGQIIHEHSETTVYCLSLSAEKKMTNGFRYIKELLIQNHNIRMYNDYQILKNNGVSVYSVKTDAFIIDKTNLEKVKGLLTFTPEIGSWRNSKDEHIIIPSHKFETKMNVLMPIPKYETNKIKIEDEWNTEEICDAFIENKRVIVRATLPGCGKSYACQKMKDRGYKTLFVCPTNKLLFNYENSVTFNKFFGIGLDDNATTNQNDEYDEFDCVVFDEVYFLADPRKLVRIKRFCDDNPSKIVIATGDTLQLECISEITNTQDYDTYADACINMIFPNEVKLQISKRVATDEQRSRLKKIKNAIFKNNRPTKKIIKMYFKTTNKINNSVNNIAYKNATCKEVSTSIRQLLGKTTEYEIGEKLICREYFKSLKTTYNVNYEYEIVDTCDKYLTIKEVHSNEETTVPLSTIRSKFIFNYCATCHSLQGSSISGPVTIFDWNHYFVDKKWLWTAITRATNLDDLYFYDYAPSVHGTPSGASLGNNEDITKGTSGKMESE